MSYIKREDIPVLPYEAAVELDNGDLVAVSCVRSRVSYGMEFYAMARAIDEFGYPVVDHAGLPIDTELRHSAPMNLVDSMGADGIAKECMMAVLGEPVEVIQWDAALLAGVSIRAAIEADRLSGDVDAGGIL